MSSQNRRHGHDLPCNYALNTHTDAQHAQRPHDHQHGSDPHSYISTGRMEYPAPTAHVGRSILNSTERRHAVQRSSQYDRPPHLSHTASASPFSPTHQSDHYDRYTDDRTRLGVTQQVMPPTPQPGPHRAMFLRAVSHDPSPSVSPHPPLARSLTLGSSPLKDPLYSLAHLNLPLTRSPFAKPIIDHLGITPSLASSAGDWTHPEDLALTRENRERTNSQRAQACKVGGAQVRPKPNWADQVGRRMMRWPLPVKCWSEMFLSPQQKGNQR